MTAPKKKPEVVDITPGTVEVPVSLTCDVTEVPGGGFNVSVNLLATVGTRVFRTGVKGSGATRDLALTAAYAGTNGADVLLKTVIKELRGNG
jgi:hypothetical protein